MEWTATRVKALRTAYRLSQEEFAELVGAAPKSVQNWETGAVGTISHYLQRALDAALERATPTQRQKFEEQASVLDGGLAHPEEATDRRRALKMIGALAGSVAMSTYLESVELDRAVGASNLGAETLQRLNRVVDHFGLTYLHRPLTEIFNDARETRQYIFGLLSGQHTLVQRTQLYSLAGWLTALIGHAALDLGHDAELVDGHCDTALRLARETGQNALTAWVLGTQALAATYRGRPGDAVAFAQAGRAAAPEGSVTMVRLHAQEARAHARVGDGPAARLALSAAERELDRVHDEPTTSILSFSYPYLPFYAGTCYTWLAQPDRAAASSQEAIELCDSAPADWPIARVLARVDLANALMQRGELDRATALASECLNICTQGRRTGLLAGRVGDLLRDLRPRLAASPVRELESRYRDAFVD